MAKRGAQSYSRLDLAFTREARDWARFSVDAEKARRLATRKLGRALPVAWRRDIQEEFNLKAAEIRDRIDVRVQGDSVLLIGRRRPIGLINFRGRWRRNNRAGAPPATAQVYRGKARRGYRGGFIAIGLSANQQIFKRTGRFGIAQRGAHAGERREKLRALYGPSVPTMFRNEARQARLFVIAADIYEKDLQRVRKFV